MDRLVIFTSHYPYGNGEPFLEEELRIAETRFDTIIIASYAKQNEALTRYIPANAELIHLRRGHNRHSRFYETLVCIRTFFKIGTWREIINGVRERGIKKLFTVIGTIFTDERHIDHIKENESHWKDSLSSRTVFYSYWLNSAATYLSRSKADLNGICICRAHGGDCFFDRGFVPWRKDVIDKLDKVFSISSCGKDDLIRHYKNKVKNIDDKIDVSRLGVELPESIPDFSARDESIIVTCSNVIPLKRLDLLIGALADKCMKRTIRWVHFGDGPQFEEILQLANQCLGNSDHVTYEFKGRKPKEEIFRFYEENDVSLFINCSDVEGIPVSVMEAMSYGIPAIARNVGSNRELVNDTCGALLPGKITSEDLTLSVNALLEESEEEFRRKRIAAAEMVRNNYHADKNYKLFFDEIEIMLREKANE